MPLYEDSLFPVIRTNQFLTEDALSLINAFDNDPDDPIEVGEKLVRVFVLPRLATLTDFGQIEANDRDGVASGVASQEGFPSIFLSSSPIAFYNRASTFTHEMSHMLAPWPDWTDNVTDFIHILTHPGVERWEWDAGAATLVFRPATDLSVRVIVNVSGDSQCDAAWSESYVRMITDRLAQ